LSVLKQFKSKLNFTDITLTFVKGYEQYLRQVRKVEDGGSFNRHKHLRAVIREAIREKKMGENPYANGNFKIKKGESKTRFLTIEEMKAIEKMNIPAKRVRLQIVKDMFLFCYYTGLRYSDMQKLSWNNIKNGEISIVMQKTGKPLKIDLTEKATEIINKYKSCNRETVFEKLSNQKLNFGLKKLLQIAEIKETFTFHDSRHAFACALVAQGVALTVIRDLMGHTSIKETDKYAKVDQRQKQSAILLLDKI
jgi:integrase/recombinase XerD